MNSGLKFKDYIYERPDMKALEDKFSSLISEFENSNGAGEQYEVLLRINKLRKDFETMRTIASIRYTINTKDKFYNKEHEFFDDVNPLYSGFRYDLYKALIESKFREELEKKTGSVLFIKIQSFMKTFRPEIIEDMKIENHLVTEYVKLIASARIMFEGEERNISGMSPFLESENREMRKCANQAKWKFFEDNEKDFDRIYDQLVTVRNQMAIKLGYKNYVQLGYDLMGRTDYTPDDVTKFRDAVKEFIVPATLEMNEMRMKRIGLEEVYYYDAGLNFKNGNPTPKGPPEWIMEKAQKMYEELSEETGKFIHFMTEQDLLDLYNRKDKSAGGYCAYIPNYESPFIFSNMNGTAGDIKVLTHEAGHAFQGYESRNFEMIEYFHPTMEAAEIHSMSMEFITWPWMNLFFEEDTDKFFFSHLSKALNFVPYGVTVDEFQHRIYENPNATPDERKSIWREIEEKYLPDINYEKNNFLEKGGFWFHQAHIFKKPFYYIDYCLAEICALQFWRKCNHDRNHAWADYMNLCKAGGSRSFLELLDIAKLESPFDKSVIESVVKYSAEWIVSANKEFEYDQVP